MSCQPLTPRAAALGWLAFGLVVALPAPPAQGAERLVYRPAGKQPDKHWVFRAKTHAVKADAQGEPAFEWTGGHAEVTVPAKAGHRVHVRFTVTYSKQLSPLAMPQGGGKHIVTMPLAGNWTFGHPQPDPKDVEAGLVMPVGSDALRLRFGSSGKATLRKLRIVDLGPPPAYKPDGKEMLADPGWEDVPARTVVPGEGTGQRHLNGWMGWAGANTDSRTITASPSRVHAGRQAVMVSASGGGIRQCGRGPGKLPVKLGRCYRFSVWAKGRGLFTIYDVNYAASPNYVASPGQWRQYHYTICIDNPLHRSVSLGLMVQGRIFFDDLSFQEIARDQVAPLLASCRPFTAAGLPPKVVQKVPKDERRSSRNVTLENKHVRVTLSPVGGGHVVAIVDKGAPAGSAKRWKDVSLLRFGFPRQPVPIDWNVPFRTQLAGRGDAVTFSHTVTGGEAACFIDGLRIEQTFALPAGSKILTVRLRLTNTTKADGLPIPEVVNTWPKQPGGVSLSAYGSKLPPRYVLQATKGDAGLFVTDAKPVHIRQPIQGWAAVSTPGGSLILGYEAPAVKSAWLDPAKRRVRWQYPRITLPPGGAWEAEAFLACSPLRAIAYADRNATVLVRVQKAKTAAGDLRMAFDVAPLVAGARAKARVVDYQNKLLASAGPRRQTVGFPPPPACFITCLDIRTPTDSYTVELFNDPPNRMIGTGIHGAGQLQYTPSVPVRVIRLPDVGDRRKAIAAGKRALWGFGLYSQLYPLDEVLGAAGLTVQKVPNAGGFPEELEELLDCRVVILSNVGASHLSASQRAALSQYVRAGGSLLVTGGILALGHAGTKGSDLEDLLPATLTGPFEVQPLPADQNVLRPVPGAALGSLPWSARPRLYWMHRVKPRPKAEVLARAGDRPAVMSWRYGRGTVLLFAGTVEGEAGAGQTAVWEWKGWTPLWRRLVDIAMKQ